MKILIVEDEVLLANSLKTLLEKKGFTVEGAYDGEAGKDYAETGVYDMGCGREEQERQKKEKRLHDSTIIALYM